MPVPTDPYTFADGPGNVASGVQVNQRFAPLYNALNPASVGLDYTNVQNNGLREVNMATGVNGLAKGAFSAYRSAAATYATGLPVVFEAEDFDVSSWYDVATGRYAPQVPGYYRFNWCVTLLNATQLAADGWVQSYLRKNGTAWKAGQIAFQRGTAAAAVTVGSAIALANGTTDFFDVRLDQNTGAAAGVTVGSAFTYFQGELIGRS